VGYYRAGAFQDLTVSDPALSPDSITVREAVTKGAEFLQAKGSPTARLDAELLLGEVLQLDRLQLYLNMDKPLLSAERDRARELIKRRSKHEPVAQILGRREFYGHDFLVTRQTLTPRPETEFLVDTALELLAAQDLVESGQGEDFFCQEDSLLAPGVKRPGPPVEMPRELLEIGLGTGCVSISLLLARPHLTVTGTEILAETAQVATTNAERHQVLERLRIHLQDHLGSFAPGRFDGIVSNPPYIPEGERPQLPPDVAEWEPAQALFGGADGLDVVRMILREGLTLLRPGGFAALELGAGQAPVVAQIALELGWIMGGMRKDLAGHDRILILSRPGGP
jgi:release factor glutamine methyltransferase